MKIGMIALCAGMLGAFIGVISLGFVSPKQTKVAYVLNVRLLKEYKGTEDVKKNISRKFERTPFVVDSIKAVYLKLEESGLQSREVEFKKFQIQQTLNRMTEEQETAAAEAESMLWKQINTHITNYGKENNYSMIIGAAGDGNLMYADTTLDVTSKVIEYMNQKYAGK